MKKYRTNSYAAYTIAISWYCHLQGLHHWSSHPWNSDLQQMHLRDGASPCWKLDTFYPPQTSELDKKETTAVIRPIKKH